jgi:hypothetical protein
MSFDWNAIESYEEPEVGLYRLLGEMLQRKATLDDLERIREFLLSSGPASDAWRSIGEALHRTTSGSPAGYDIWVDWTKSLTDFDFNEVRQGEEWAQFGEEFSEAVDVEAEPVDVQVVPGRLSVDESTGDLDDDTNVLSQRRATSTGILAESATQLLRMVPTGPYSMRIFGRTFPRVDEYAVLTLIKRGLFLGAEVRFANEWIPAAEHPAFSQIAERLQDEAFRILSREPSIEPTEQVGDDDVTRPT